MKKDYIDRTKFREILMERRDAYLEYGLLDECDVIEDVIADLDALAGAADLTKAEKM